MGAPVLVGAGIGAISSLATGRNPLQGALLGGVTGGAFGGSTGFGSGFTEGGLFNLGSSTLSSIPEIATEGVAQSAMTSGAPSSLLSGGGLNVDMALNPMNIGMGGTTATQAGYQAASPFGSVLDIPETASASGLSTGGGYVPSPTELETAANINQFGGLTATPKTSLLEDIGTTAYEGLSDMNTMDQVQLAQMGIDSMTPEEQQMAEVQMARISPPKQPNVGEPLAINMPRRTFRTRFA
jgi:hypothetical protein